MREDSRGSAARSARGSRRTSGRRDIRPDRSGGRAGDHAGLRSGPAGSRPGPAGRRAADPAELARLISLIEPVTTALEMDLEAVRIGNAGRRRVLRIIVDSDGGVSLDAIAEASREVSAALDAKNAMGDFPYTLEVSSPGVDRPLTAPRHWRRAVGRLVKVRFRGEDEAPGGGTGAAPERQARVLGADEDGVTLEIDGVRHVVGYAGLGPGRVQVEFGGFGEAAGEAADDLGDAGEGMGEGGNVGGSADEEDPDGH